MRTLRATFRSMNCVFGGLAVLSLGLLLWQWMVAVRFPLHERVRLPSRVEDVLVGQVEGESITRTRLRRTSAGQARTKEGDEERGVTLLKPLKGCEEMTADCLRSWMEQEYAGPVQILFGVASADDPVCGVVRDLMGQFPGVDAELIVCGPLKGTNAKVAKLAEMAREAKHEAIVISDADVRVPRDFLANVLAPLADEKVGLVNCFYRLANPVTAAMEWEAVAIDADFWSQVLQARSLKPLDFALGAVMATRRKQLAETGGFEALADVLADDYQLGNRIARMGHRIELSPVVVECWSRPMGWRAVWKHQLRWGRTVRVCQPLPYFFSILSNATLWPLLWVALKPSVWPAVFAVVALGIRMALAWDLQRRLGSGEGERRSFSFWMPLVKDVLQLGIWAMAFAGNRIEWAGQRMKLGRDGTLRS
jgi:ceramide glucosyltransferase